MNSARWMSLMCLGLLFIAGIRCFAPPAKLGEFDKEATKPLRVILALMVIFAHLPYHFDTGTTAVSVFFFMSGYGLTKSFARRGRDYLKNLPKREVIKLLLPAFLCVGVWLIGRFIYFSYQNLPYGITQIASEMKSGDFHSNIHSWFPWALLFFAISFSLVFRFFSSNAIRLALVFLACGLYYATTRYALHLGQWWWVSTWSFPIGIAYANAEPRIRNLYSRIGWRYPLIVAIIYLLLRVGYFLLKRLTGMDYQLPILSELAHNLTGVIVVTLLYVIALPRFRWLMALSVVTYELYLVHGMVFRALCSFLPWQTAQFAMIVAVPLLAWLLHKTTQFLTGHAPLLRECNANVSERFPCNNQQNANRKSVS